MANAADNVPTPKVAAKERPNGKQVDPPETLISNTESDETTCDEANSEANNEEANSVDTSELEARAIAQAMASADASYVPSPSLLAADEPEQLLVQVDGPSLSNYPGNPSVYQAKSVPVALRAKFDVPIHVVAGGSVVEYEISTDQYDIGFGVTAEREEGVTNVKESSRVDSHLAPVTGKFLVGSVPCALVFSFNNEYSWFREKRVSYKITVTPPKEEQVIKGRRLRAKKCLEVVVEDQKQTEDRFEAVSLKRSLLEEEINKLGKELAEKKKNFDVVLKEESWLGKRREIRSQQISMLTQRLNKGWDDENGDS